MRILLGKMWVSFTYPKPVDLIAYLIDPFSGADDWILDSFAGSGTTGHAVLRLNMEKKTKRKWFMCSHRAGCGMIAP
jgi:adenine-specific DNA-methyltransferase